MGDVEMRDKDFCEGCKKRRLKIYQETHYNADGTRTKCDFSQCEHLPVCMHLAERLAERYEQEIDFLAEDRDTYMNMYHNVIEEHFIDDDGDVWE